MAARLRAVAALVRLQVTAALRTWEGRLSRPGPSSVRPHVTPQHACACDMCMCMCMCSGAVRREQRIMSHASRPLGWYRARVCASPRRRLLPAQLEHRVRVERAHVDAAPRLVPSPPNPNPNPNPNPDPNPNPNPTPEPKPDPNPNQVLLPAGERVTAVESTREGEMCTWEPVGVRPSPPSLWAAISGAVLRGPLLACVLIGGKSTAIALALRRLLPVGWDRPLGP